MSHPLNVLFVEPPPLRRLGGIETALSGLTAALPAAGVTVTRSERADAAAVQRADVVHFHGLWELAHVRPRALCRGHGKPFVISPHGMMEPWAFQHRGWKKWPYFHLFERRSVSRADVLLATSELEAGHLRAWFPADKVQTLPLGGDPGPDIPHVEARRKLGLSDDDFVVLFLSRCHEKKGLHLLVAAMPLVSAAAKRPLHLVVVGSGDPAYVVPLQKATDGWANGLRCTWTGACWGPGKWDYLSAADVLCLPSYSENFGLAVLESLFAGSPVLTTRMTPWPSLRGDLPIHFTEPTIQDLVSSLTVRVNAPRASDPERADTRMRAISRFEWPAVALQYAALYQQLGRRSQHLGQEPRTQHAG